MKTLVADSGWLFLVNDHNEFMKVLHGEVSWNSLEQQHANSIIDQRVEFARSRLARYHLFIVPEKAAIYPEYLPLALRHSISQNARPAQMLAVLNNSVHDLTEVLTASKSLGFSYFRGDSHPNWFGGWLIYRAIVDQAKITPLAPDLSVFDLQDLTPAIAAYNGDLYDQMDVDTRQSAIEPWEFAGCPDGLEVLLKWELSDQRRLAHRVRTSDWYETRLGERETITYERRDGAGERAVIFRDSSISLSLDYIAQHFSRSVFVWHQGKFYGDIIELEKPDVILHVVAERFVRSYNAGQAVENTTSQRQATSK